MSTKRVVFLEDLEEKINKLELKRKDALAKQDGVRYARLCNKLGMEPEDSTLYQAGADELMHKASQYRKREREIDVLLERINDEEELKERNLAFLKDGARLSHDWSSSTDSKYSLLVKLYPYKFGPHGSQDISVYSPAKLGKLFESVYAQAEKKYKQ
jgi:hypothetical protein